MVIAILLLKGCEYLRDKDNLLSQINNLRSNEQVFKKKLQDDSSTINTQQQVILTQNDALKLGILELEDGMKKVQSQVKQVQNVKVEKVSIPYVPENYVDTSVWFTRIKKGEASKELLDSLLLHSVLVPKKFEKNDKWWKMYGVVKKEGVSIDSLFLQNESKVTIGWKRKGFLNLGKERVVDIKNTNPYFDVSKMNNVVINEKKGILQNKFFLIGVGVIGGIFLHSKL